MNAVPELSVVMIAGDQRARAQRTADVIAAHGPGSSVELIVVDVVSDADSLRLPASIPSRRIDAAAGASWGALRATGARDASAPVVAFIEDHCAPCQGWAEALVEAHRRPWAAVGYAFVPANPSRWRSRAILIAEYGFWAHPLADGRARMLPGNNISYKRDLLLALGDELNAALEVDDRLHRRFAAQGLESGVSSRALVAHQELLGIPATAKANYDYGRVLVAARRRDEGWGLGRRISYAAAVPLGAPVIRTWRLFKSLRRRPALWSRAVTALPAIAAIWTANAFGQASGSLLGTGRATGRLFDWELTAEREAPLHEVAPRAPAW
jgi:hypothetical protein